MDDDLFERAFPAGVPDAARFDLEAWVAPLAEGLRRSMTDPDDPAEVLLNTQESADAAHVNAAVIRRWRARGLLHPVDPDDPHPRYRELEVLTVEKMTRRQKREAQLASEAEEWARRESA